MVGVVQQKNALPLAQLEKLGVYPPRDVTMEVWVGAVHAIARAMFPLLPADQQLEALGREVVRSFANGVVGRGVLMVGRLLGRRRTLMRMAEHFRTADSVMNVSAFEKTPQWVQIRFGASYGLDAHLLGVVREGVALLTPTEPCVIEGAPDGAGGFAINVTW